MSLQLDGSAHTSWMSMIIVDNPLDSAGSLGSLNADERARRRCEQLEQGDILLFRGIPFGLPEEDRRFLLLERKVSSRYHKNISYRPNQDMLRGFASGSAEDAAGLRKIMRDYSARATEFLSGFLLPYAKAWSKDFASVRPFEEATRVLPLHKRNDLLHIDAFPTRPTRGARILRVFTNINPVRPRIWNTTDHFDVLAERFALDAGLGQIATQTTSTARGVGRRVTRLMKLMGFPVADRSPYDKFMVRFHNYLKENVRFQSECKKTRLEFPPNSTWLLFTDAVPHAVLSGQFAVEHTYIIPTGALLLEQKAPIRVLEALCGRSLD